MRSDSKSQLTMATRGTDAGSGLRRAAARVLLGLAALALAACSTGMRLGYNNADTLLLYSLGGYVSLTPEQEALVKERAGALVGWHRSTQLRDYAQFIEQARGKLAAGPVSAQEVLAFNEAINARMALIGERAAPDVARLALTLSPEQVERLQRRFADDAAKARREAVKSTDNGSPDERARKYVERAEYWFGSVTPAQRALLREELQRRPDGNAGWRAERERRQQELLRLLRRMQDERPDEATATAWVRRYFAQLREPPDAERRRELLALRTANAELIAQLVNSATPEQRATLSQRLAGFAEDFTALAAGRGGLPPG